MDLPETFPRDVGVDFGGADAGVAEHGLDGAEVGAVRDEMCGEGMAQDVWRQLAGNAGLLGILADSQPHVLAGHGLASAGWEHPWVVGFDVFEPAMQCDGGGVADGDDALFAALPSHDEPAVVEGFAWERDELGDAEAGGVEQLEHGVVAAADGGGAVGGAQEGFDLGFADGVGEVAPGCGHFPVFGGIDVEHVVFDEEAKEGAGGCAPPCERGACEAVLDAGVDPGFEVPTGDEGGVGDGEEEALEVAEVVAVGGDGVR